MTTSVADAAKTVYWHRDLPPLRAEVIGEHTLEAVSGRVPGTLSHRDEIWDRCYEELMANTHDRLNQEIGRVLNNPDTKEKFFNAGGEAIPTTPEQFASLIKADMAVSGKLIRDAGIRAE